MKTRLGALNLASRSPSAASTLGPVMSALGRETTTAVTASPEIRMRRSEHRAFKHAVAPDRERTRGRRDG
jgi:hypothetical protein